MPRPAQTRRAHSHDSSPSSRRFSTRTRSSFRSSIVSLGYLAENDPQALDKLTQDYLRRSYEELPLRVAVDDDHSQERSPVSITELTSPDSLEARGAAGDAKSDDDDDDERKQDALNLRDRVLSRETQYSSTSSARPMFSPAESVASNNDEQQRGTHRRSQSFDQIQARATKKAQKLASFFGTTRGEVWHLLLDDLQHAIEEEEGVDDDEKQDVLDAVARLRDHQSPTSTHSSVKPQ